MTRRRPRATIAGMTQHPLDRPVWHSLNGRQASLGLGDALARRFQPEINLFAAAVDGSPAAQPALMALLPAGGTIGLVEAVPPALPEGATAMLQATLDQMVLTKLAPGDVSLDWSNLGDADAADMLALATLTRPGPFFAATHRLGAFVGVRRNGQLVAMAGERMKPDGYTEVSAVATHPDWRGQGLAAALMRIVIARILARGEVAFLHVYPDNPAVAMYRALGFKRRTAMTYAILERATAQTG